MKRNEDEGKFYRFERLAKKGMNMQVRVLDKKEWRNLILSNPKIPRTYSHVRRLAKMIYDRKVRNAFLRFKRKWPKFGVLYPWWEECAESVYSLLNMGLQNPFLNPSQLQTIESDIDADMPTFEHTKDTTHFTLHWTDSSADASDNISDEAIIDDTGDYLETAWDRYKSVFGRAPYVPSGSSKIDVYFYDLSSAIGATSLDGGIDFDSSWWNNTPGIRQPTSAHELFHRLQYEFGYRRLHTPSGDYKWFSEGTASWSEVFVWNRVSLDYKMHDIFNTSDTNLLTSSYRALPFWIFFDTRQRDDPNDISLVRLLQEYEIDGDIIRSVNDTIFDDWPPNNVYNQLDRLFALFSRERRIGAWEQTPTGGHPYRDILDSDGNVISPTIQVLDVNISFGDTYAVTTTVNPLASDYYNFVLDPNTAGKTIAISVDGSSVGDFSFYIIWEKDGQFKRAIYPFFSEEDYGYLETIDLDFANALVLIVSGRMNGGSYSLTTNIY